MGNMNIEATVTFIRQWVERELLPDTCNLYPLAGSNPVISGTGHMTSDAPQKKVWRTLTDIPCRIDVSRAFRPGRLKTQASEIDEYNLELPYDVDVKPSDRVVLSDGREYKVMKFTQQGSFNATQTWVIEELGVDT